MYRLLLSLTALAFFVGSAPQVHAGVLPVAPFTGTLSNPFDSMPNYVQGPHYLPAWEMIGGNQAQISNPFMIVYQPGVADFGLGSSGIAQVPVGLKGLGIDNAGQTTTITFAKPASEFGAFWGAATLSPFLADPSTVSISFYDASHNLINSLSFTYSHSTTQDGGLDWHGWSSSVGIGSVTFHGDYVALAGLQATLPPGGPSLGLPEPASLTLVGIGAAGVGGYVWRRRRMAA
jgi:hypothetical protein